MSKPLHPTALFRLMVLGPLTSRSDIQRGEIKAIAKELASKPYNIPDSKRTYISKESILQDMIERFEQIAIALKKLTRDLCSRF